MSELIALAWEDIDLLNRTVKIRRANVKGKFKMTKTKSSCRTIELISQAIVPLLRQRQLSRMLPATQIDVMQADYKTIKQESVRFVFVNSRSLTRHASEGSFGDRFFKTHLNKAKVRYRGPGQARHTFASQLLTAGVNERWIIRQMGHTTIKMLEQLKCFRCLVNIFGVFDN
jgi:integrase